MSTFCMSADGFHDAWLSFFEEHSKYIEFLFTSTNCENPSSGSLFWLSLSWLKLF